MHNLANNLEFMRNASDIMWSNQDATVFFDYIDRPLILHQKTRHTSFTQTFLCLLRALFAQINLEAY